MDVIRNNFMSTFNWSFIICKPLSKALFIIQKYFKATKKLIVIFYSIRQWMDNAARNYLLPPTTSNRLLIVLFEKPFRHF